MMQIQNLADQDRAEPVPVEDLIGQIKSLAESLTGPHKVCKECQRELPLSSFNKNSTMKGGYVNTCKPCKAEYGARYRANRKKNPRVVNSAHVPTSKACRECKQTKTIREFGKSKNHKDGHLKVCRECMVLYRKESKVGVAKFKTPEPAPVDESYGFVLGVTFDEQAVRETLSDLAYAAHIGTDDMLMGINRFIAYSQWYV